MSSKPNRRRFLTCAAAGTAAGAAATVAVSAQPNGNPPLPVPDPDTKALEQAGFKKFRHLCLVDMGMQKGKTSVTPENVDQVVARGRKQLNA